MPYTFFLAEKNSAGETFAKYLAQRFRQPLDVARDHISVGSNIKVGWLRGHLLENVNPEAYDPIFSDWSASADRLPLIPSPFKLAVKEKSSGIFMAMKRLALGASEIVNCADPDDQGELLSMQFLRYVGIRGEVKRWAAVDMTNKGLDKSFDAMSTSTAWQGSFDSARAQNEADWLYGMNMTRACTVEARRRGANVLLNVGRVKTPTWAMIVARELELRNFKPKDFYKPWIDVQSQPGFRASWKPSEEDPRLDADGHLADRVAAQAMAAKLKACGLATVTRAETTPGVLDQPPPFSLDTLQAYCGRIFGWDPSDTLAHAQELYQRKLISYPRTPTEYIPETHHAEAPGILTCLAKAPLPSSFAVALRGAKPDIKSPAFDDKKISGSHYAVIPTELEDPGAISTLSADQAKCYFEIVRRYLVQFWPQAKVLRSVIELEAAGEVFSARGRRIVEEGWRAAFTLPSQGEGEGGDAAGAPDDGDGVNLPKLSEGDVVRLADAGFAQDVTKAPKRYTTTTLLDAMKNAHTMVRDPKIRARLREKEGLGTPATRGELIKETVKHRLFSLGGKGGREIIPSEDAIRFISMLPQTMTAPDMTALWQLYFDDIKRGQKTYADFMQQQATWLTKMVASVAKFMETIQLEGAPSRASSVTLTEHACTACGANLKHINGKHGWFFACSNDACKKLFTDFKGMPAEKTGPVDSDIACPGCNAEKRQGAGFLRRVPKSDGASYFWGCSHWKSGCKVSFDDIAGQPDLERKSRASGPTHKCPKCDAGQLRLIPRPSKDGNFWGCSGYRDGCKATYNDLGGAPDFEGVSRQQGATKQGGTFRPAAGGSSQAPSSAAVARHGGSPGPGQAAPGAARWGGAAPGASAAMSGRGASPGPVAGGVFGGARPPAAAPSRPAAGVGAGAGAPRTMAAPRPQSTAPATSPGAMSRPTAAPAGVGAQRQAAPAGRAGALSFAERMRRHGGNVAYDPGDDLPEKRR